MKKKATISLSAILLIIFTLRTCVGGKNTDKKELPKITSIDSYVSPPFSQVTLPRNYFELDLSKDTVLSFGTTKIHVPSCAFMDSANQVVKGKIRLSYREANTPGEILISGVPMELSNNSNDVLESAGMLELLANKNDQTLFPNPDCHIKIAIKSKRSAKNYNLYSLDTVGEKWDELKKEVPVIETKKAKQATPNFEGMALKNGIIKPVKPQLEQKKLYQFKFKMDFSQYPELNIYNGVKWEFVGRKNSENPDKNPWVKTAYWNEMEIIKRKRKGVYKLKLTSKGKVFTTTVKPVFSSDDMEYANFVFEEKYKKYRAFVSKKKKELAIQKARREKARKRREVNASVTREFKLQGFGWANIDRIMKQEQLTLDINFQDKHKNEKKVSKVFLFMEGINSVITYSGNSLNNFKYGKNKKVSLVVIDEDANVFKVSNKDFNKVSESAVHHTFTLKKTFKISSQKDVLSMLDNKLDK